MIIENDSRVKECPFCNGSKLFLYRRKDDHHRDTLSIHCGCGAYGRDFLYGCEPYEFDTIHLDGDIMECFDMVIKDWNERRNVKREIVWGESDTSYSSAKSNKRYSKSYYSYKK